MRRKYIVPVALMMAAVALPACSSSATSDPLSSSTSTSTSTTSPSAAVHSFLLGGTQSVDLLQFKGSNPVEGVFEEVLGPQVTSDGKVHDFVYRLAGSTVGHTVTYQLTAVTPDTPAIPGPLDFIVGPRTVTLAQPVTGTSGRVMIQSTQGDFNKLVHAHETTWRLAG